MSTITACCHGIDLARDHCNLCSPEMERLRQCRIVTDTITLPAALVREVASQLVSEAYHYTDSEAFHTLTHLASRLRAYVPNDEKGKT